MHTQSQSQFLHTQSQMSVTSMSGVDSQMLQTTQSQEVMQVTQYSTMTKGTGHSSNHLHDTSTAGVTGTATDSKQQSMYSTMYTQQDSKMHSMYDSKMLDTSTSRMGNDFSRMQDSNYDSKYLSGGVSQERTTGMSDAQAVKYRNAASSNPNTIGNILGVTPNPEQAFYGARDKQFSATFSAGFPDGGAEGSMSVDRMLAKDASPSAR